MGSQPRLARPLSPSGVLVGFPTETNGAARRWGGRFATSRLARNDGSTKLSPAFRRGFFLCPDGVQPWSGLVGRSAFAELAAKLEKARSGWRARPLRRMPRRDSAEPADALFGISVERPGAAFSSRRRLRSRRAFLKPRRRASCRPKSSCTSGTGRTADGFPAGMRVGCS